MGMVGSIASSPAIDLSGLPAPDLIPQPDFEARLAGKIAQLVGLYSEFTALVESDPAIKLLQADAYDEMVLVQSFVEAAQGLLLAFATGPRLDHLGVLFGVGRLELTPAAPDAGTAAVMESDEAFKQRIQLAPHSFSVAGPELAYVYHARSAHPEVADATAVSPTPGQVVVTVLSTIGDGVPSGAVLDAVRARLGGDVRPLTDEVIVQAVTLVDFTIDADLFVFAGPDQELIRQTALGSLAAYREKARRLGRDVTPSGIIAALHVANVERVVLNTPSAPIAISPAQISRLTATSVSIAGTVL